MLQSSTTPPSTPSSKLVHSRSTSISIPVGVYSSNRFKRRFKNWIVWTLVLVTLVGCIELSRTSNWEKMEEEGLQAVEERGIFNFKDNSRVLLVTNNVTETTERVQEQGISNKVTQKESPSSSSSSSSRLPVCSKTLLFKFAGLHGQGSELNLLLRIATLSTFYNYTLLLDSSNWNYGPFSSYFQDLPSTIPLPFPSNGQPSLRCRLPNAEKTKRVRISLNENDWNKLENAEGEGDWEPEWVKSGAKHVVWGPKRDVEGLDQTVLKLFVNSTKLEELHSKDQEGKELSSSGGLNEEESLNFKVFGEVYERLSDEVKRIWRINSDVQEMVDRLGESLGVPEPGGNSNEFELEEKKSVGDLVIGVHVRLGDKYLETDRIGPPQTQSLSETTNSSPSSSSNSVTSPYSSSYSSTPGLSDSTVLNYFAASIKSINNLLPSQPIPSLEETSVNTASSGKDQIECLLELSKHWELDMDEEEKQKKPTLVLMSDDETAVEKFKNHPLAVRFRVVGTSIVDKEEKGETEEKKGKKRMVKIVTRGNDNEQKKKTRSLRNQDTFAMKDRHQKLAKQQQQSQHEKSNSSPSIPAGFNEITFNSLPLSTRIQQSRKFVRDVTFLSTRCDALVITGSSNVGRLMSLLFGARERGMKSRIRSLDTRWFPTAKFT
ncbi:hypothetical protein JCM5350_005693 [Sporobolomyces pararoseus]